MSQANQRRIVAETIGRVFTFTNHYRQCQTVSFLKGRAHRNGDIDCQFIGRFKSVGISRPVRQTTLTVFCS